MNNNRDITILQGSQLDLQVYQNDPDATDVDLVMKNDNTDVAVTVNAIYVDGVAQVELLGLYTGVVGVYSYQINENLSGGGIVKYGTANCPDCDFGKIIICESLDGVIS